MVPSQLAIFGVIVGMENVTEKRCSGCKETKSVLEFNKCTTTITGYQSYCRVCTNINRRKNYIKKPARTIEEIEACKQARKERKRIARKSYKKTIKTEESKIKSRLWAKKWIQDPKNRISTTCRQRIRNGLKGICKSKASMELLGCDFEFLKDYLESKFLPGMTWENYGLYGWHIDHITPVASFDLLDPEQQKKCFHYSNLQPLWAKDNLVKGSKNQEWREELCPPTILPRQDASQPI